MKREERQRSFMRPHVLIVSDDPSLSQFLGEGLLLGGFWTSVVASGLQTMEVFRLRQFDIVLVDASLTGFQSLELVRRLRGRSDRADRAARTSAPIVLIAESEAEMQADAAHAAGAQDVLYAPLELEHLVPTLHGVFEAWREANPHVTLADETGLESVRRGPSNT